MARFPASPAWHSHYCDDLVSVWINGNDDIHMKAKIKGGKSKQFYKETAHADLQRWVVDETGFVKYWSIF